MDEDRDDVFGTCTLDVSTFEDHPELTTSANVHTPIQIEKAPDNGCFWYNRFCTLNRVGVPLS